jgi:hypothetical protein
MTSKSHALQNHRKVLDVLKQRKDVPVQYLHCEEDLYRASPGFIIGFLEMLKRTYADKKEFIDKIRE